MTAVPDRLTLALFAVIVTLGGLNFVAVRFSNQELPPFWGAGLRFGLAAVLLFALTAALRLPLPRGKALGGAVLYGALAFGATYAFGYYALVRIPAGVASLVVASVPVLALLLAVAHRLETFQWRKLMAGLLAMSGIAVIFVQPGVEAVPFASLLAMLAGASCMAESSIVAKLFPTTHPVTTNAVGAAVGSGILLVVSVAAGEERLLPATVAARAALVYLVVLGTFTLFMLFLFVLKRWTVSAISYQFVLFPLVAISVSAWLEREPISPNMLLGGALVLTSVYLGVLARPRTLPPAPAKIA